MFDAFPLILYINAISVLQLFIIKFKDKEKEKNYKIKILEIAFNIYLI